MTIDGRFCISTLDSLAMDGEKVRNSAPWEAVVSSVWCPTGLLAWSVYFIVLVVIIGMGWNDDGMDD